MQCLKFKSYTFKSVFFKLYFYILISILIISLKSFADETQLSTSGISILQGATGYTSTQLAILRKKSEKFKYEVIKIAGDYTINPDHLVTISRPFSEYVIDQVFFDRLNPGSENLLEVKSTTDEVLDRRVFRTISPKIRNIKIAFASCMSDSFLFPQSDMWSSMIFQRPDIMFFLGDNVYASVSDPVDPQKLWKRYVETRKKLDIFYALNLIPVFATWDDHDFGWDDGNKTYPYVKESQEVFNAFFPQQPISGILKKGPGISQYIELFNQLFIFPDNRTFRDPKGGNSMWGAEQEDWMNNVITNSIKPIWIMSGSQIFGKYGKSESMERDYPTHLNRFKESIKKVKNPILIISGDLHASEIMKLDPQVLGQQTYEITSSSMHTWHGLGSDLLPNPRRIAEYDGDNFITAEFNPQSYTPKLNLQSYNKNNDKNFDLDLSFFGKRKKY